MNCQVSRIVNWVGIVALAGGLGLAGGCDDTRFDREPPPGMGTMVVDNYTGDDLQVYINGQQSPDTSAGNYRYYDLIPRLHRVALDGEDVNRSWAGDVDILENRRTVVEVRGLAYDYNQYEINVYFD